MRKSRIQHKQKQKMSAKMKLVIGASVFTAAFAAFLMIDLSDTETSMAEELTGEYRVVGSGEWDDQELWQVYNGSEWVPADEVPGKSTNTIIVSEGSELVVTEEATMNKIIIEKGARLVLSANSLSVFKMGGKGGIDCKGTLDMDECIIEGNGDFKISDEAVLHIGSPEGIDKRALSGNIQIRGAVELSKKATYVFDGNVRQSVGNGLPASVGEIRINNASGVFMQTDVSANVLNIEQGVLFTGPNVIRIGTSPSSPGSIVRKSGCVQGSLNKWYGTEKLESLTLPMGDEGGVSLFRFNTSEPSFSRGLIEMKYHPGKPDENFVSPFAAKEIKVGITEYGYFTAKLTNGPDEALLQNEGTKVISSAETVSTWKMIRNNSGGAKSDEEPKIMTDFLLGPNPFSQSFTLTFSATEATMATIQLVNKAGKVVASEIMPVESGKNKFQFSDGAGMAAGDYVIRISNPMEIHTLVASKK